MVTSPSAGATIRSSPSGVVRTGSRKNAATQIASPTSGQNSSFHTSNDNSATAAAIATNTRPLGWTDGKRHLTVVVASGGF